MDVQFKAVLARRSLRLRQGYGGRVGRGGSSLECDSKDFRFESCAAANLACLASHECANTIPRELALGLLIEPLHLRYESLEWFCDFLFTASSRFIGVAAKLHFNRLAICAE